MRILIGADGSTRSAVACELVAARSWPVGTRARLVAVVDTPPSWAALPAGGRGALAAREAELAVVLDDRAELLRRRGIPCDLVIQVGRPEDILLEHAVEWWADLLVVGNRGRGAAASAVFGSVSAHLVDHAPCPVLVARSPHIERMLIATDGTRSCLGVPRTLAAWRPAFHGVEVEVLSIATGHPRTLDRPLGGSPESGLSVHRRIAEEVADEMVELGWAAAGVTRAGDPGAEIVDAAEGYGADLVVTGSRCLGTLGRLIGGSVAHAVLLGTHASVLVVRGQVPARASRRRGEAIVVG